MKTYLLSLITLSTILLFSCQSASSEITDALKELKNQGATRFILDLRGNPGGLLHEAVNICNLFVPKNETIVTTKAKNKKHNNTYKTLNEPNDLEIPLTILFFKSYPTLYP